MIFAEEIMKLKEKVAELEKENVEKEVLLKSNIELKVNQANAQFFDFSKYNKLKLVFFRKDDNGNRTLEKIFEIRLSDNSVASVLNINDFYVWFDSAKKYADIRRQTSENLFSFCDVYGIL